MYREKKLLTFICEIITKVIDVDNNLSKVSKAFSYNNY